MASDGATDRARRDAWHLLAAAQPSAWLVAHSRAVEALAAAMCDQAERAGLAPERAVALPAAILHDLGRTVTQDVRHASLGAELLRQRHAEARVVLAVERHTGAGIPPDEAAALGLPVRDYTPRSLEERIVAHADNLYTGDRRLSLADLRLKYEAKGLPKAWARIEALHRDLGRELGVDLDRLEPARLAPLDVA